MRKADCHAERKYHCKGMCRACYAKHRFKINYANPTFREKAIARVKKWARANPERVYILDANKHLVRNFGITLETYNQMRLSQNNKCAICFQEETIKSKKRVSRLAVDHCHKTNQIRGLLCFKCNTTIAHLEKHNNIINKIVKYLGAV